jgi:probable HAF family extracellular repeat protein
MKGLLMRHSLSATGLGMGLFLASLSPLCITAQDHDPIKQPRYRLVDVGTFGGPSSKVLEFNNNLNQHRPLLTNCADTAQLDPDYPNVNSLFAGDLYVQHAYRWSSGRLTDLGPLPGGTSSCGQGINAHGDVAGFSSNGAIDPLTGTPEIEAVLWRNGEIINLGTLGGNNSYAAAINDRGQITGNAYNSIPDPFSSLISFFGATQVHAFLSGDGGMRDLGTLGGPDSIAFYMNERSEVAGNSFTNSAPNATTGIPTLDPFLWSHGRMLDLGTLGGTIGIPDALNSRGQVAGFSNLAGDQASHPFLWDRGVLKDLGTFGGSYGEANGINDDGVVVGRANFPGDNTWDAFLWENGEMTDLGNLGCKSNAFAINSRRQVVGTSVLADCATLHSALWQDGKIYDLNDLIPSGSNFELLAASYINDEGVIAGIGFPPICNYPDGCIHAFLLFPCNGESKCENQLQSTVDMPAPLPAQGSVAPSFGKGPPVNESHERQNLLIQRGTFARWRSIADF